MNYDTFQVELAALINRHNAESGSDTPDFILASHLTTCLKNFNFAVVTRDNWYGHKGLSKQINETVAPGLTATDDDFPLGEACSANPIDCEACQ